MVRVLVFRTVPESSMPSIPRRVVTGHDERGVSVFASDPTAGALSVPPAPNGTKIRINEFPPGVVSPMHCTQSVDYGIVLSGEVVLVLDDSETVLLASLG